MARLYNLARMTTAATGTGTITLNGAVDGFLTFAEAGVSNGETVSYSIRDGSNTEIGRGVYTSSGTTLTRSVLKSTNANAAINLTGGAEVFISALAEDFNVLPNTLGAFGVGLAAGTNVTANRTLTLTTGDANRTLDLSAGSATISAYGATLVDDADASTARTTLGLAIGTDVQAYDADLAALAGLTSAANKLPYFTGSAAAAVTDLSAFGRTLIDDADVATARSTLGLVIGTNVRERLTANRTYYVRTDGSDANDGLSNAAGGAFLTIQKAIDVVASLDISIYTVTIQLGNTGTWTGTVTVSAPWVGSGDVTLLGSTGAPSSYLLSTAGGCVTAKNGGRLNVSGIKMASSASYGVAGAYGGIVNLTGACSFGACSSYQISTDFGYVNATANYEIAGAAYAHYYASGGQINVYGRTPTNTGTNAFSYFAFAQKTGVIFAQAWTSPAGGTITGTRHYIATNGVIDTAGGTEATFFPGDATGTKVTGGQFV